jgi:NAD+ synthase (glutamine-hydrolysing)
VRKFLLVQPERKRKTRTFGGEPPTLRVALAQVNTVVGDFQANARKVRDALKDARRMAADIVLFPELTLTGYPPEDLLLKPAFIQKNLDTLKRLTRHSQGLIAIVGFAEPAGSALYNAAALLADGRHVGSYRKMRLPNYGVFDEKRYFREGERPARFTFQGRRIGLTICEDIWDEGGPGRGLCEAGGLDLLLNISSSPYHKGKWKDREAMIANRARAYRAPVVYANLVGGQDELVFDGHSLVVLPDGSVLARGGGFVEEMIYADVPLAEKRAANKAARGGAGPVKTFRVAALGAARRKKPLAKHPFSPLGELEEVYQALVLGTRDYLQKNGFENGVIGLSGGVDSALTAKIGCDAIGPENIVGVLMPSPYSSRGSVEDSLALATRLGIRTLTLPIEEAMHAYEKILAGAFKGMPPGVAEENLQARIRGNLLMALSNKMGWLVLTTGNKSEYSVGYCTLYGDMAGGFAVLKDVPKTWVYDLCRFINRQAGEAVIPENVLTKEPSAELRPNQKDSDSLPPYPLLDRVLSRYIEGDHGLGQLRGLGLPAAEVRRIALRVDANEYKRRQSPPGVKITPKSFGRDRRLPITNHFKG